MDLSGHVMLSYIILSRLEILGKRKNKTRSTLLDWKTEQDWFGTGTEKRISNEKNKHMNVGSLCFCLKERTQMSRVFQSESSSSRLAHGSV